jgi:predicted outer membrane protein
MPRNTILAAVMLAALGSHAWGQANLAPDPIPRLPAQPGQSLPAEDVAFLEAATAMSRIETKLGELAGKAPNPDVQQLGQRIAEDHRALEGELTRLAKMRQVDVSEAELSVPKQGGPGGAASAVTTPRHASGKQAEQAPQRLSGLTGDALSRGFVEEQLVLHGRLVDLYQTQASNTADTALASFAIKTLVELQRDRDELRHLAGQMGIAADVQGQPPQYGEAERARQLGAVPNKEGK